MDFSNPGVVVLREGCSESYDKVLVCGLPRSGTTGVAAALEKGGVPMSFSSKRLSSVKEDQAFRAAIVGDDVVLDATNYFKERRADDSASQILGVKYPEAYKVIDQLSQIDGLVIVVVARDPFLVAMRNAISMFEDFEFSMDRAIGQYADLMRFVFDVSSQVDKAKIVIVGYEKLLATSVEVLIALHGVMGLRGAAQKFAAKASVAVEVDSQCYLKESNLRPLYAIDHADNGRLSGWCFYQAAPSKPVILTLRSLGLEMPRGFEEISVKCVNLRPDLKNKGLHPTGCCGFVMDVGEVGIKAFEEGTAGLFVGKTNFRLFKK